VKIQIAIKSCVRDQPIHDTIRETWLKECPVNHCFYLGGGAVPLRDDEAVLYCADDRNGLSNKLREIIRRTLNCGYDFIFACDADTYVHVPRLLASGFEGHDYSGSVGDSNVYSNKSMCCAGSGFWLSQKAMLVLKDAATGAAPSLGSFCDDWWVFHSLYRAGIFSLDDPRYRANREVPGQAPSPDNDFIILHDSTRSLRDPALMREAHQKASRI
jgi:hypothetical protein